ncbi:MAG: hypothetical protein HYY85_22350 [Deltaproteobacteria bacterium]|nr:hypothetical protein [Deltaproteobacteria bacterium]
MAEAQVDELGVPIPPDLPPKDKPAHLLTPEEKEARIAYNRARSEALRGGAKAAPGAKPAASAAAPAAPAPRAPAPAVAAAPAAAGEPAAGVAVEEAPPAPAAPPVPPGEFVLPPEIAAKLPPPDKPAHLLTPEEKEARIAAARAKSEALRAASRAAKGVVAPAATGPAAAPAAQPAAAQAPAAPARPKAPPAPAKAAPKLDGAQCYREGVGVLPLLVGMRTGRAVFNRNELLRAKEIARTLQRSVVTDFGKPKFTRDEVAKKDMTCAQRLDLSSEILQQTARAQLHRMSEEVCDEIREYVIGGVITLALALITGALVGYFVLNLYDPDAITGIAIFGTANGVMGLFVLGALWKLSRLRIERREIKSLMDDEALLGGLESPDDENLTTPDRYERLRAQLRRTG